MVYIKTKQTCTYLCFLLVCLFGHAQDYNLIVKYEVKNNIGEREYYWIIPDSCIKPKGRFKSFPLYLDHFSNNDFKACLDDQKVDLFTSYQVSNYNFDTETEKGFKVLRELVKSRSKKVLIVNKKHTMDYVFPKQKIEISVLPVQGEFLFCTTKENMKRILGYIDKIAIPKKGFQVIEDYLESNKLSEFLFYADLSSLYYVNDLE